MEANTFRIEKDSLGTKDVPENVYYGVQTLRAAENFRITGLTMHSEIINSLAYIKKAAAITNCEVNVLDKKIAQAIVQACDEIIAGNFHEYFIVDPIQGGAGTSINMNANEVIANRAIEILGGQKRELCHCSSKRPCKLWTIYQRCHPNCWKNDFLTSSGKFEERTASFARSTCEKSRRI